MPKTLAQLGEFGLINRIKTLLGKPPVGVKGIGDDTAVVPFNSTQYLLLTTDMLIEGVHFTKSMPTRAVGHKAIAASLSDIAAMGGTADYALVSLGVPSGYALGAITALYAGMKATARRYHVAIVGGDTVKSRKLIINVAMTGKVAKHRVVTRAGARAGDQIFVTGPLGRSLSSSWHARFIPRLREAAYLTRRYQPTAMIDISDGLAADLGHILRESRKGARLEEGLIPRRKGASLREALNDGEDFELLVTVPPAAAKRLCRARGDRFKFYRIGEIVGRRYGLQMRYQDGRCQKIQPAGFTHF